MPRIEIEQAPGGSGASYPAPFDVPCRDRHWRNLDEAAGITQFGVNIMTLPSGAWSSQRHWHTHEDEFACVLSGEVVLVENDGETILHPGDCIGWPMNTGIGHCLQNRTDHDARILVVGGRSGEDWVQYPDIDLKLSPDGKPHHKDGSPYE